METESYLLEGTHFVSHFLFKFKLESQTECESESIFDFLAERQVASA